jgi:hypothetical protein
MTFLPQERIRNQSPSIERVSALDQRTISESCRVRTRPCGITKQRARVSGTAPILTCEYQASFQNIVFLQKHWRRPDQVFSFSPLALFPLDQTGHDRTRPLQLFFRPRALQTGAADEKNQRYDQDKDQIKYLRDMGREKHADEDK